MNQTKLLVLIQKLHEKRIDLLIKKQAQYVGGKDPDEIDPFANFKRRGPTTAETPVEVCFGDITKHIDCLGMMTRGEIPVSLARLEELCKDAHNYIDLIYGQLLESLSLAILTEVTTTVGAHSARSDVVSFSKEVEGKRKHTVATKVDCVEEECVGAGLVYGI